MPGSDIEHRHPLGTEPPRRAYDWGDPGPQRPTRPAPERTLPGRMPPGRMPGRQPPGRHRRQQPPRRRPFPVVFLVLALASVFTFVAVGLALGGALFSGEQAQQRLGAGDRVAAPCELSPGDQQDRAEEAATGTTKPPERDDSPPPVGKAIGAIGSTDTVPDRGELEDLALWVHPTDPKKSVVIGADKGCNRLFVYDLAGKTLQSISLGPITGDDLEGVVNVDVRRGFKLGGHAVDVVVATDQANGELAVFTLNRRTRQLQNAAARKLKVAPLGYGVCMYSSSETGKLYAFVTQEEEKDLGIPGGLVQQWELFDADGRIDARRVREMDSGGEAEGCVADDQLGQLYIGNHNAGVFRFGAEPADSTAPVQIDTTGPGGHLVADVEGLALVRTSAQEGYLIASSQGNNSFAVYDRADGRFVKNFNIRTGDDKLITEIDGIDATTENLGTAFPRGVFVVQADGQTFKMIPLQEIVP
jgi:3-phytase